MFQVINKWRREWYDLLACFVYGPGLSLCSGIGCVEVCWVQRYPSCIRVCVCVCGVCVCVCVWSSQTHSSLLVSQPAHRAASQRPPLALHPSQTAGAGPRGPG